MQEGEADAPASPLLTLDLLTEGFHAIGRVLPPKLQTGHLL